MGEPEENNCGVSVFGGEETPVAAVTVPGFAGTSGRPRRMTRTTAPIPTVAAATAVNTTAAAATAVITTAATATAAATAAAITAVTTEAVTAATAFVTCCP